MSPQALHSRLDTQHLPAACAADAACLHCTQNERLAVSARRLTEEAATQWAQLQARLLTTASVSVCHNGVGPQDLGG